MPERILLTGGQGYLGRHLYQHLVTLTAGEVHTTYRRGSPDHPHDHPLDLCDKKQVIEFLGQLAPAQIYHLAGNLGGRESAGDTATIWNDNLTATLHLYEACVQLQIKPRMVYVSSGSIYGQAAGAITETTPLRPASAYAASKAAADLASGAYWLQHQLPVMRARLFNYLGPRLPASTALGRFAQEITRLERERPQQAILPVGSLHTERDYLAVNDVSRAFVALMQHGQPGEAYNIASGISRPMQWYLEQMLQRASIPITVMQEEQRARVSDTVQLQVDISKFQLHAPWRNVTSITDELQRLLDSYRE